MGHSTETTPSGMDLDARRRQARRVTLLARLIPAIACGVLAGLYLLFASLRGFDLRIGLEVVVANASLVALVATGATFIFTCGSFDLSLGSNMLVSALVGVLLGRTTGSMVAVAAGCMGTAILLSLLNATLATFFNLPVFIMTIVMMNVYSAAATLIITSFGQNSAVILPAAMTTGLNSTWTYLGIMALYEVFCCVLFYLRPLGRRERFLGGDPICARLTGIRAGRLTILSFGLAGIGIGAAALLLIVQTPTLSASSGSSVGMNMLIALVFGGMNMNGGPRSRMYAALLGAFSMAFLDALMNIFVTGSWYLQIVKGILFVAVVFLFSLGRRQKLLER